MLAASFHYSDCREIFWLCAGGFLLLTICVLFVDGTRTLGEPSKA